MKNKVFTLAVTAMAMATAVPALAQRSTIGLSPRIGVFLPALEEGRDISDGWLAAGVDFDMGMFPLVPPGRARTSLSIDYIQNGGNRSLPILINYVAPFGGNLYYTAGIGPTFTRAMAGSTHEEKTYFAYGLGVGMNIPQGTTPAFVEARFHGTELKRFNGFGLYVGLRL